MKILYSHNFDRLFHDEVNAKRDDLSRLFAFDFPVAVFDPQKEELVKPWLMDDASQYIDIGRCLNGLRTLYGDAVFDGDIFLNTTPFSSWDTEHNCITLSYQRFPEKATSSFCHELNHFFYDTRYQTEKYQDTEIKESLTILNESFGIKDYGWKIFEGERKQILEYYLQAKNLDKTLEFARSLFDLK